MSRLVWKTSIKLQAETLRDTDPLPDIIQSICALQGMQEHTAYIAVILTELFSNALDYGLLNLDSNLKSNKAGFFNYYANRQQALSFLSEGWIKISCEFWQNETQNKLIIEFQDSGNGFNVNSIKHELKHNNALNGRGIYLVNALCEKVSYFGCGNHVQIIYSIQ